MTNIENYREKIFDEIKHVDENGVEYWEARELMPLLEYSKWQNFHKVICQAMIACKASNNEILEHFTEFSKPIIGGKGNVQYSIDYKLTRYACYLIVQNANPKKKAVALGQTYFAIQTRKMELTEEGYEKLSEDEKRIYQRNLTRKGNIALNETAKKAGVKNFDKFHNAGYRGLYNGETANQIAKRKGLRYRADILDNMGSEELADNMFRIVQTDAKLKREKIHGENNANITHYNMGRDIREFIKQQGGTMPEDLPTPDKSIKELERKTIIISYDKDD